MSSKGEAIGGFVDWNELERMEDWPDLAVCGMGKLVPGLGKSGRAVEWQQDVGRGLGIGCGGGGVKGWMKLTRL